MSQHSYGETCTATDPCETCSLDIKERKADALDAIFDIMDGEEWSADTTQEIAQVLTSVGYTISDSDDLVTYRFTNQCHLTYITDSEGRVVRIELMPWDEPPSVDDYQEDGVDTTNVEALEAIRDEANKKVWELPGEFPAWVEWC